MPPQRLGQPPDQGGHHGPVRPVQTWSRVGAAEHRDFMPQDEQLDVLGGGRAAHQQDQSEHVLEDQIQEARRRGGDHARLSRTADHRWSTTRTEFWNPTGRA